MVEREILVANTKTQKRSKLTTSATTLGELKAAMDAAGIDYSGMTFTEGISKTQLLNDDTQLPQNVMFKGNPTNNLVILLTNTKKNIASGAGSRKEAYEVIKANDLAEGIKEAFGTNYTHVSTADLWDFIDGKEEIIPKEVKEETPNEELEKEDIETYNEEDEVPYTLSDYITDLRPCTIEDTLVLHIATLADNKVIDIDELNELKNDITAIINLLDKGATEPVEPVSTSDGSISNDDVTDIIKDMM